MNKRAEVMTDDVCMRCGKPIFLVKNGNFQSWQWQTDKEQRASRQCHPDPHFPGRMASHVPKKISTAFKRKKP